jgi:hypothetical protein
MGIRKILRKIFLKKRNYYRYLLERKIFPQIRNKRILLVGIAEYTKDYPKILAKKNNEVWTLEINPELRKYGAKRHIVGDISKSQDIEKEFFDIVLMLGVFGFGLNKREDAEKAMRNVQFILKKKGILIIQWVNDMKHGMINPKKLKNWYLFKSKSILGFPPQLIIEKNKIIEFLIKR